MVRVVLMRMRANTKLSTCAKTHIQSISHSCGIHSSRVVYISITPWYPNNIRTRIPNSIEASRHQLKLTWMLRNIIFPFGQSQTVGSNRNELILALSPSFLSCSLSKCLQEQSFMLRHISLVVYVYWPMVIGSHRERIRSELGTSDAIQHSICLHLNVMTAVWLVWCWNMYADDRIHNKCTAYLDVYFNQNKLCRFVRSYHWLHWLQCFRFFRH